MAQRVSPCGWSPDLTVCRGGPCCPDLSTPDNDAIRELASSVAVGILWALTGRRYGACPVIVRPCKPLTCDPLTVVDILYWDQRWLANGNLGVNFGLAPLLIDGQIYNIACGCPTGCCKCRSNCEILLPGPVSEITEIIVDGEIVEPEFYQLYDSQKLVFQTIEDVTFCPGCQDYNKPAGEVGTWTVEYTIGTPVPVELDYAAGLLACEIAKGMVGDATCSLPSRVQHVTRTGVDIDYFDPVAFANAGLTGLPVVDSIIRALNPNRLAQEATCWFPGKHNSRRAT